MSPRPLDQVPGSRRHAHQFLDRQTEPFREGTARPDSPTLTGLGGLYLTYGTDAANMLFHVVNERHRRHRSMIFTTIKALKAWGRVLHDEDLGQAIIDRVLEGRQVTTARRGVRLRGGDARQRVGRPTRSTWKRVPIPSGTPHQSCEIPGHP